MLKNYLLIAIRNLGRNKAFSFVNIFGLSIGLTCSILILLWVHDELTWDRFHTRIDQLYRVYINRIGEQGIYTQKVVPLALLEELKNTTGVRYATATNGGGSVTLSYEDKRIERDFYFGNSDFWKMFSFNFVEGAAENLRDDVFGILLTESTAKALFGDESALGKAVKVENHVDLTVTGVIKDPPGNSTLQFQCYIPIATMVALGATLYNIVALFSRDFSKLVLTAFLLSAPLTWWIMDRWLQQYSFRIEIEWWMIGVVGIFTVLLTWFIVGLQATRAAMINPTESLRAE